MVVDTSAIVAILLREPLVDDLIAIMAAAETLSIAAPTAVECAVVMLRKKGEIGERDLDAYLSSAGIGIVAFDADLYSRAKDAFRRYGKGRHPASLNFGDCFSYALAKSVDEPLLCIGGDFARTDLSLVPLN